MAVRKCGVPERRPSNACNLSRPVDPAPGGQFDILDAPPGLPRLINARRESFWATLKVEFHDRYLWPTKAAAKVAVGDWIEPVYNRRSRHFAIAMMSPVEPTY